MKRGILLFSLFVIILFISGCVEYPDTNVNSPQYSKSIGAMDDELPSPVFRKKDVNGPVSYDVDCGNRCQEKLIAKLNYCMNLPPYEMAVCYSNAENWFNDVCIPSCEQEPSTAFWPW